ncbi:MAG TPA: transglycosylase SLT domain-containing protein [Thermoanaerobaculia bacterium]|nr:transglycosylase SLT domain-containing protein [Thermoanaerobaculia bacterium]
MSYATWSNSAPAPSTPAPTAVLPSFDPLPLAEPLAGPAAALRRGDCAAALAGAAAAVDRAPDASTASFHTLVEGLYAHACEDLARAEVRLMAATTTGPLEDWRLLVLADAAAARGHATAAASALDRLVAEHPGSPLRPRALMRAGRLAWDQGDAARALAVVDTARREGLAGDEAEGLDLLAWEIALASGDRARLAAAGRRLLVHHPLRASELQVSDLFAPRTSTGAAGASTVDWAALLTTEELKTRASRLLAADLPDAAKTALAAVAASERDLAWRLLAAEALTAAGDGVAALSALDAVTTATPAEQAQVAWRRAMAGFEAARVRRGRTPLPSAERDRLRAAARRELAAAGGQRADLVLARRALGRLFRELWEERRVDEGLALLARLREIDPQDLTGTRALWEAGWADFERRNPSGAIGYWSELVALYPESAYSRNARYWTGRAHERLGNVSRAHEIYREVVAGEVHDFYTRYAEERLGAAAPRRDDTALAEDRGIPWPRHPELDRARLLTDLGLDALAESELTAVTARGDGGSYRQRAASALDALVLARRGDRRTSISRIHDAYPALGGPLQGTVPAEALRLYYPLVHGESIGDQSRARDLSPFLVAGMVRQESAFDVDAISHAGARGLLQLMPATSREMAGKLGLPWSRERLADPDFNLTVGTAYFRQVLTMFDGDVEMALAGYNGGPYRIKRLARGGTGERDVFFEGLPVPESRLYVKRILMLSDGYRQLYPEEESWGGAVPGSAS